MSVTVVDLFAGAGGFSEGFFATGCDVVAHIEMNKDACETISTRAMYHALEKKKKLSFYDDYRRGKMTKDELISKFSLQRERDSVICAEIEEGNYKQLIKDVKKKLEGKSLDLVIGGPPCQAYSMVGRARDKDGMKNDKRNHLYKYYVEFLKGLKPKMFVFENVPGLKSAGSGKYLKDMQKLMAEAGYTTDLKILNAADFGVPQNRKRVILVGWDNRSKLKSYPNFAPLSRSYVVGDFFADLPEIKSGGGASELKYKCDSGLLKSLKIRDERETSVFDHITRPHIERDLKIYEIAIRKHKEGVLLNYKTLPKNLKTHKNQGAFLDRYKVVDSNARAAQTVVAHISKDGHYYIHPDAKQRRSLSVREAARLQTFPDNYRFEGSRTSQFKQIGNAVPPLFANIIAKEIIKFVK